MEITTELKLNAEEQAHLVTHSALNVLNVLIYELLGLEKQYGPHPAQQKIIDRIMEASGTLANEDAAISLMENMEHFIAKFNTDLDAWGSVIAASGASLETYSQAQNNLKGILSILLVRARELAARANHPDAWETYDIETLRSNFINCLRAIEKNSKGRYRIVYNIAESDEGAYFINFNITSHNSRTVRMPAVFQDIMRDLLANARKYTAVGGRVDAGLYDSGRELRFVITDNGRGIPEDEVATIVDFGKRASNVADVPTRGGGFGLTKAYYYTRHFGGRFWIDSAVGKGTSIEIKLPYPNTVPGVS